MREVKASRVIVVQLFTSWEQLADEAAPENLCERARSSVRLVWRIGFTPGPERGLVLDIVPIFLHCWFDMLKQKVSWPWPGQTIAEPWPSNADI